MTALKNTIPSGPISAAGDQAVAATQSRFGTITLATTAANQKINIPALWRGRPLMIQAIGLDIDVVPGTSTTAVAAVNAVSTMSGGDATLDATSGPTVFAGTTVEWHFDKTDMVTTIGFISSGTTGFIKVWPSSSVTVGSN